MTALPRLNAYIAPGHPAEAWRDARSRELSVVTALARIAPSPLDDAALASGADGAADFDWRRAWSLARHHGVLPLVHEALVARQPADVRPSRDDLLRERLRLATSNLVKYARWQRLNRAFDRAGITAVTLKGFAVALDTYGSRETRVVGDLDFLVSRKDVLPALAVLAREGYYLTRTWQRAINHRGIDFVLAHGHELQLGSHDQLAVDLHWAIGSGPGSPSTDAVLAAALRREGAAAGYWTLPPALQLVTLIGHGSKSNWSRLRWLVDVAESLERLSDAEAIEVRDVVRRLGVEDELAEALALVARCWGTLPNVTRHFGALPAADERRLRHIGEALERAQDVNQRFDGTRPWRLLRERVLARRGSFGALVAAARPTQQDWAAVRLPRGLGWAYYLVRPLRVLRAAARAAWRTTTRVLNTTATPASRVEPRVARPAARVPQRSATVSPDASSLTFVTAIYSYGPQSLIGGRGRGAHTYVSSLRNIANLQAPLVVFCPAADREQIAELLKPHFARLDVRAFELEQFPHFDLVMQRKAEYRDSLAINDRNELLCFLKLHWLATVSAERPFGHDRTFWIDAGLTHHGIFPEAVGGVELGVEIPASRYAPENPANIFTPALAQALADDCRPDRVTFCALPFAGNRRAYLGVVAALRGIPVEQASLEDHLVGGVFGGHAGPVATLRERFDRLVLAMLQARIYTLEEQVFSILHAEDPALFHVHRFATWYFHAPGERTGYLDAEADSFYKIFTRLLQAGR